MKYTVNRGEKGKIEVKVDVPRAGFDEAYRQSLDSHVKNSTISGFRPGMAPAEVVEKHIGISKILNESASFLVNKHLSDIFQKENLLPIDSPKVSIESLGQALPFSFTVTFTQKPQVKIGDWKKLKVVKVKAKEITEADILASIKNIFEAWRKSSAAKTQQGKEPEEGKKYIYDAQGNKIFVGDEKGASEKKVETHKIDDDFAKAIGAKDLAHLKEIVKGDLERIVADQVEVKLEQEVFEKLSQLSTVEVPDILVEDELNRILVRLSTELERQGKELDDYLKEQKTTIDELKNKWREQAEKNVKTTLVMDEIGRQEKVQVSKEEVEAAMKGVSETNLTSDQRADLERYIALSIFQAKTLDLVKKTVSPA